MPRVAPVFVWFQAAACLAAATPDYPRDIKPLLARHCVPCHGPSAKKSGLLLDTAAHLLQGGDHGPAVVPGQPEASPLMQVIGGTHPSIPRMPYKRPPIETSHVTLLRDWIAAGLPAPTHEAPSPDKHWSLLPVVRPPVPSCPQAGPLAPHPIDAFIHQRLADAGVAPVASAEPPTLLRRLHLDLTGLPPTPEDLRAFLTLPHATRVTQEVDRLLASPAHGERWARWWLDVARYADSNGYSIDGPRPIWPYRDWVVRALNADLGFDTFTRWQLAGDLLQHESLDALIASGFHRNTQVNHEGGIDPEEFRVESAIDRVNTTGTAWLGLSVGCAQCHDHKFDPLTQRDYFQLFAYFNSLENDGHGASDYAATGPVHELPTPAESAALNTWHARLAELEANARTAGTNAPASDPRVKALAEHRRKRPAVTRTLVMRERAQPRDTFVFIKGDFTRPGQKVSPGIPAVFNSPPAHTARGDRRDLADWIASPANPLTARVVVNRVWQAYFGRGLVETENDFGTMGSEPTHPALLDWLAAEFMESGWSLKHLHRLITSSATYQRASIHHAHPNAQATDPRNLLLARQSRVRLDAESIRDMALAASGLLDRRVGGPPVFPPQPEGLGAFTQSKRDWPVSKDGDRFRRALYTHLQRATLHPALAAFDAPDTFTTCTRRQRSNNPLQALTLLNDPAFNEIASALARRIEGQPGTDHSRAQAAFAWVVGRPPDPSESALIGQLLAAERQAGATQPWRAVARVLLNLDEAITRE